MEESFALLFRSCKTTRCKLTNVMESLIHIPREEIAQFCERRHIAQLAFFGSVIREDFTSDSDVDVLVTFAPESRPTLFDMVGMQQELEQILGRKVDLLSRKGVENSRNPIRRKAILESAAVFYAA